MNELAQLVPKDIDFSILASLFWPTEIGFVVLPILLYAIFMSQFNKKAWKDHGALSVYIQCMSRVALDIGLVLGIAGSAIGVVAMTMYSNLSSNLEGPISIVLLCMVYGGIFVGLGYFLHNPKVPIEPKISRVGFIVSLLICLCGISWQMVVNAGLSGNVITLSESFVPYLIVMALSFLCLRFNDKPWAVSFTDANLIATMGGLGMGIVLWFTSGGGYEEGRAAIYTCAITLMWGSIFYIVAYIVSLYLGTQEQGNYQTKTWHLSEGAVFFIFLLYAPVGATEWQRESKDQAVQEANNQAQELRIEQLEAQIAILMKQAEKT